jgi:glycosyl transferase family 25
VPEELRSYFVASGQALSPGEIGCYASHLAVCRKIADGALASPTLILEDDVQLDANFGSLLVRLVQALPADWDIVRMSYPTKRATLHVAPILGAFELVRYSHVPTSTGAYLLSRAGALKFLDARARDLPVDHDLRRVWAWNLRTYGVSPPPVRPNALGPSSIDAMAPGARSSPQRRARFRRRRLLEAAPRFRRGVAEFGALRWCAVETLNLIARALPRRDRAALFAWASNALAQPPGA